MDRAVPRHAAGRSAHSRVPANQPRGPLYTDTTARMMSRSSAVTNEI